MTRASGRLALVLDWDGTVTEQDTLHMAIEQFGDVEIFRAMERELGRALSLREVISREMATITASLDEVVGWLLEHVRLRRGFHELVARHDPLIVSAGFHELIEPVLRREGISARLVAHHVVASPAGWRTSYDGDEPCEACGEPCKRASVAGLGPFAFVGDGVSDHCVSLAADIVFARADLASYLQELDVEYSAFEDFTDVRLPLAGGDG